MARCVAIQRSRRDVVVVVPRAEKRLIGRKAVMDRTPASAPGLRYRRHPDRFFLFLFFPTNRAEANFVPLLSHAARMRSENCSFFARWRPWTQLESYAFGIGNGSSESRYGYTQNSAWEPDLQRWKSGIEAIRGHEYRCRNVIQLRR